MRFMTRVGVSLVCSIVYIVLSASAVFAQCKTSSTSYVPMSAVIAQGGFLSSDGKGAYVDDSEGATVNLHNAANLGITEVRKNPRAIAFNLNGPVVGDPYAVPLGLIQDRAGEVHVLYKL